MKFRVQKNDIVDAVSDVQRAVSVKSTYPALECFLVEAESGGITLSAYDTELGITTVIPAFVEEPGRTALPARIFSDIVRRTPSDDITVTVDEKEAATIESGHSRFSVIGVRAEDFPELPRVSEGTSFSLPSNLLKSMLRQTLFAIGNENVKPIMQGSLFKLEEGLLNVVSIDGFRLAVRTEHVDFKESMEFVVPGKTLGEVLKLLGDTDDGVSINVGRKHILFTIGSYTVISSLLSGSFIDYESTIPGDHKTEANVKTREFIESVERVSLIITDRVRTPVRCMFEENSIRLSSNTVMGRASDQVEIEMTGDPIEIGFNNRYLLEALRNTECDEIHLELNTPISPLVITPKEGDSFLFLVLPVRLRSQYD